MNIAIVGYGKMGKVIESVAKSKGINVIATIDPFDKDAKYKELNQESLKDVDICIDFTNASAFNENIKKYCELQKNVVVGTTGWYDNKDKIRNLIESSGIGCIWSGNYSIGVNIYLKVANAISKIIDKIDDYDVMGVEYHHNKKADSPSGTMKMIGDVLLKNIERKKKIIYDIVDRKINADEIHLASVRGGSIPGTHELIFDSEADTITLTHSARSRIGFAKGAVTAAQFLLNKKGFFNIDDLMTNLLGVDNMSNDDKIKFHGVYTAIVTPFKDDESVDYETLRKLIEFQIANGVSGIVPCGTTGESPTLTHEEQEKVIEETIKIVNKRVTVIAGTGSNCTKTAIELSKKAEKLGVDAILSVNPYYNKPTQEGLYRHFKAICNAVKIPVVLYNIKGRTGVNVETSTLLRLISECKNLTAVKEASGDMNQIKEVINQVPDYFSVLSGDDGITLEVIKSGGDGVISVASNVLPKEMSELVKSALVRDLSNAEQIDNKLQHFFKAEFIETNPIPIKSALAMQGKINEVYRLPLCELSNKNKEELRTVMTNLKLL